MECLIVLLVSVVGALLFLHCIRESRRNLEARVGFSPQPEISDAEFCELMPGVDPEIAIKVREICSDVSGWDREEIHPQTRIVEFELW